MWPFFGSYKLFINWIWSYLRMWPLISYLYVHCWNFKKFASVTLRILSSVKPQVSVILYYSCKNFFQRTLQTQRACWRYLLNQVTSKTWSPRTTLVTPKQVIMLLSKNDSFIQLIIRLHYWTDNLKSIPCRYTRWIYLFICSHGWICSLPVKVMHPQLSAEKQEKRAVASCEDDVRVVTDMEDAFADYRLYRGDMKVIFVNLVPVQFHFMYDQKLQNSPVHDELRFSYNSDKYTKVKYSKYCIFI